MSFSKLRAVSINWIIFPTIFNVSEVLVFLTSVVLLFTVLSSDFKMTHNLGVIQAQTKGASSCRAPYY